MATMRVRLETRGGEPVATFSGETLRFPFPDVMSWAGRTFKLHDVQDRARKTGIVYREATDVVTILNPPDV